MNNLEKTIFLNRLEKSIIFLMLLIFIGFLSILIIKDYNLTNKVNENLIEINKNLVQICNNINEQNNILKYNPEASGEVIENSYE